MLAACTARRWLARNAARVKHLDETNIFAVPAPLCTSLVSCLPGLEHFEVTLVQPLPPEDLGSLLEALSWCPRLRSLSLCMKDNTDGSADEDGDEHDAAPQILPVLACLPAFARLHSLTKLELFLGDGADPHTLSNMVHALAPLTALAELELHSCGPAVFPATLRQLKGLRALKFCSMAPFVFEAGCLDLPLLQSLEFHDCVVKDAAKLSGITALQSLTSIASCDSKGPAAVCSACAPAGAAACGR